MGNDASPRPGFDRWASFRGQGVYNDPPLSIDGQESKPTGYITDILSDHAAQFIEKPRSKPFCAYLGHKSIHGPFTPTERHKDLFKTDPLKIAAYAADDLKDEPAMTNSSAINSAASSRSTKASASSSPLSKKQSNSTTPSSS